LPSFAPKIRVEVYVPIRPEPTYQNTLSWLIEEFTQLRGGCTVNENAGGYYLSQSNEVIEDRVSVVYSDFPMNWDKPPERTDVINYCAKLTTFLLDNLWEEEILIGAYPVSHLRSSPL
jgi:hypothetical protein